MVLNRPNRPTTGVLLAPCHDEFRGPRSDYVRQVALKTTTTDDTFSNKNSTTSKSVHSMMLGELLRVPTLYRFPRARLNFL
ncbi:hypothetical protein TNCV_1249271 [Trichonephila clavipes]|nr:hypothetical protein TNCV_1249271 [Trichonephila clavipes]